MVFGKAAGSSIIQPGKEGKKGHFLQLKKLSDRSIEKALNQVCSVAAFSETQCEHF